MYEVDVLANCDNGCQEVHEGEEVHLEEKCVDEVCDAERERDGDQCHQSDEQGASVEPHATQYKQRSHSNQPRVLHQ